MPLSFLTPLFLAGLAAVAIPVLVHLVQRRTREVVDFPSLMFLQRIPVPTSRRKRLRDVLLLALRCLAIILLAAAFARPFVDRELTAGAGGAASRDVVVLLDRSYSMAHGDRWERAVTAARGVVDALGPDDRAALVLFDRAAAVVVRGDEERSRFRAALEEARPGDYGTRYAPALKLAETLLASSDRPRREVVLVSDFQAAGWEGEAGARLPPGAALTTVPVADGSAGNVAVTGLSVAREPVSDRDRITLTARVANLGDEAVRGLPVTLEVDGTPAHSATVDVDPRAAGSVAFPSFVVAEPTRITIRARADDLPRDDAFHAVVEPAPALRVLLLEAATGRRASSLYLRQALALGDEPRFRVEARPVGQAVDLDGYDVVVLNGAPAPGGARGRALTAWVERGGGLLVAAGDGAATEASGLLPPTGAVRDRADARGGALGHLDLSHPVFELFRTPRSGDFTSARFFRYRSLEADSGAAVLARFDDGTPALLELRRGAGRVLVWGSTLDAYWNDLPLQPVFVPFTHRLAGYLAAYEPGRPWLTVGAALDPSGEATPAAPVDGDDSAPVPEGGQAGLPSSGDPVEASGAGLAARGPAERSGSNPAPERTVVTPSGTRLAVGGAGPPALPLDEAGFYEVLADDDAGAAVVAVNLDVAESDLTAMDPRELAAAVAAAPSTAGSAPLPGEEARGPVERERRQSIWWYLLAAAFLLLAAETLLSNRPRGARVGDGRKVHA